MKKFIIGIFVGLIISGIGVYAAEDLLASRKVTYNNSRVDGALNELYQKAAGINLNDKKVCKLIDETYGSYLGVGSKYECEVATGVKKDFYLLSNNGKEVELIMDRNISSGPMSWYNAMKYFRSGAGVSIKNSWTNVLNIDLPRAQAIADAVGFNWVAADSGSTWWCLGSRVQDMQAIPYCNAAPNRPYAWLLNNINNCTQTGCTDVSNATADGYWTRDLVSNSAAAWAIYWHGDLAAHTTYLDGADGVRPVITVLPSNLYRTSN